MTESEVWQQLEDAFRNSEWDRATILADALQECGKEALAETVRWAALKRRVTYNPDTLCTWKCLLWERYYYNIHLPALIVTVDRHRAAMLKDISLP